MDKKEEERLEYKQYMQVADACRELFKKNCRIMVLHGGLYARRP